MKSYIKKTLTTVFSLLFIVFSCLTFIHFNGKKVDAETTNGVLTLEDVEAVKANGISYDLTYAYGGAGFIMNAIPTDGDIYMRITGYSVDRASDTAAGNVFGFGRITDEGGDQGYLQFKPNAALYYGYNGGAGTYTPVGETNTWHYSVANHCVYKNGSDTAVSITWLSAAPCTFEGADDAGSKYFGLAWYGAYGASINIKFYDANGNDLGVYCSTSYTSCTKQLMGTAGETITVKPNDIATFGGFEVKNSNNEKVDLTFTDNQDGTYSFTMPNYDIKISAIKSTLDLVNVVSDIDGIFYNVSLSFSEGGAYFANAIPATGDIYMSFTTESVSYSSVIGEVFGFGRGSALDNANYFQYTTNGTVSFTHNGGTSTLTPVGQSVVYRYSVSDHKIYNGTTDVTPPNHLDSNKESYEASDNDGAKYFAIVMGGTYSATLKDFKCYDSNGNDLGIYFSTGRKISSSVERIGIPGETITIKPDFANVEMFGGEFEVKDMNGENLDLTITDNQDGTYSFTMPKYPVKISAKTKNACLVENVELTYRQPYNMFDEYSMRTEYTVTFSENVLSDYETGSEITDNLSNLQTKIKINGVELSATAGKARFFKVSDNKLNIMYGRPIGYAEITFSENTLVKDYLIKEDITFYQDGTTFSLVAPSNYKVNEVFSRPCGSPSGYTMLNVSMNKPQAVNQTEVDSILLNGTSLKSAEGVYVKNSNVEYGNDWDAGSSTYQFYIYIQDAILNKGAILTFPADFGTSAGANKIPAEQSFAISRGLSGNWGLEPTWNPIDGKSTMNVSFVSKDSNSYTLKFEFAPKTISGGENSSDIFAEFSENADMTVFINANKDFINNITVGDSLLSALSVSYKKGAKNTFTAKINQTFDKPTVIANANVVIGETYIYGDDKLYVSNSDNSIAEVSETVNIESITSERSYGVMSRANETRFSFHLSKLGLIGNYTKGDDLTALLNNSLFMDKVLINGATLSTIGASKGDKKISVYKYARPEWKNAANTERVYFGADDAIEIIIPNSQIFDYDVTILEGCIIGNLKVAETVTFHKNYEEEFEKVTMEDTSIKPIAIREIPYGQEENRRCLRIIFNNGVSYDSSLNDGKEFIEKISFSLFDKTNVTGGKYFNSEAELASRSYVLIVKSDMWLEFLRSSNPQIIVDSFNTANGASTKVVFTLKDGLWIADFDNNEYTTPTITAISHPGNQDNDLKLFMFDCNISFDYWNAPTFFKDNLFVNGKKIGDYKYSACYCNPEIEYDCKKFALYIDDNMRNYEGGVDVIYLKKGTPLSGGRIIGKDLYFYCVQDKNERDGAYNWKWTVSDQMPDLELLHKETYSETPEQIKLKVYFDRVVAKDDVLFGIYDEKDVSAFVSVNGNKLSILGQKASYIWGDNYIEITIDKSALDLSSGIVSVKFENGFVSPLGYTVSDNTEETRYYDMADKIWIKSTERRGTQGLQENVIESVSDIKTVNYGKGEIKYAKRIVVNMKDIVAGKTMYEEGVGSDNGHPYLKWYKNISAPLTDLYEMTKLGYRKEYADAFGYDFSDYAGYNYTEVIMKRTYYMDLHNSVLDKIFINNESLRTILAKETAYVALENYPIQVDYKDNTILITVQQDSVIYNSIKNGLVLELKENLVFENDNKLTADYAFVLQDGVFTAKTQIRNIVVTTTKIQYYKGQDLDLTRFIAYCVNMDGTKGTDIVLTLDMISGYDKNTVGKQTITFTYEEKTTTLEITVIDTEVEDEDEEEEGTTQKGGLGCFMSLASDGFISAIVLSLSAIIILKKKKKNNDR